MKKKLVQIKDAPFVFLDYDILVGDLEEVARRILGIRDLMKDAYDKREFTLHDTVFTPYSEYQYIHIVRQIYSSYDADNWVVEVYREETDDEYKERLQKDADRSKKARAGAEKRKENQRKRELELLTKLQAKYPQ